MPILPKEELPLATWKEYLQENVSGFLEELVRFCRILSISSLPVRTLPSKKIRVADGIGNKSGSGSFVDLFGGAVLRDLTFFYNGYPITHIEGFLLIVGQVNEPCTQAALDVFYFDMHLAAKLKVRGAQGFVKQNHIGLKDESPSECDPLCCWPPLSCFG